MFTFEDVQNRIGDVLKRSESIQIEEDRLNNVVENWSHIKKPSSEIIIPQELSFEQKLMFVFVWGLSDFCYWPNPEWTSTHYKQYGSASEALGACYRHALEQGTDILNPVAIDKLSEAKYDRLLQNKSPCRLCFGSWRLFFIRYGMRILQQKYQGRILTFLKVHRFDAQKIVAALSDEFFGLNDQWLWQDIPLHFLHRAQKITQGWDNIYAEETGQHFLYGACLNLGADDKTPCALRRLNILKYAPDLDTAVRSENNIAAGSSWEIALRAAGMSVVDKIKKQLRQQKQPSDNVEQVLWLLAQTDFQSETVPHKTVTWFY